MSRNLFLCYFYRKSTVWDKNENTNTGNNLIRIWWKSAKTSGVMDIIFGPCAHFSFDLVGGCVHLSASLQQGECKGPGVRREEMAGQI